MRAFVIAFVLLTLAPPQHVLAGDTEREMRPPQVLSSVTPEYTDAARAAGIQGIVELRLDIDAEGHLKSAVVETGLPYGLNDAAAKCVEQWTFAPAMIDGKPAAASILVKVEFRLPK